MYTKGTLTKKVIGYLDRYDSEMSTIPTSEFVLTHSVNRDQLLSKKSKITSEFKNIALTLKRELESTRKQIQRDKESLFFPNSGSYDANRRSEAMNQRLLAQSYLNSGELTKDSIINAFDNAMMNANYDFAGQIRESIIGKKNPKNLEEHLQIVSHINNAYKNRGLDKIQEREADLNSAEAEFQNFKLRFPSIQ